MRRIAAGITVPILAAVTIAGPWATAGQAAPATIYCGGAATSTECLLLDELAAELATSAPVLGPALTAPVQDVALRADQPAGVPAAEVAFVSQALLDDLAALPSSVEAVVGAAALGELTDTLQALVDDLTAPVVGAPSASGSAQPTPAKTVSAPSGGTRSSDTSLGGTATSEASPSAPVSSDAVPAVPVGDPLILAPLALPDFEVSHSSADPVPTIEEAQATLDEIAAEMDGKGRGAELAVVVLLSLLLIGGAAVAQVQQNRRTIPQ